MAKPVSTSTDSNLNKPIDPEQVRQQVAGKHVCPFCGTIRSDIQQPCSRCMLEDTASTRNATRARIGPWYVMQSRNPSAPGMKFATLVSLIRKGHVSPRAIVRGPTTQQMWAFAVHVRGVSRELGLCWQCGSAIEAVANTCEACGKSQEIQGDPDAMLETTESRPRVVREIAAAEPAPVEAPPAPVPLIKTPPALELSNSDPTEALAEASALALSPKRPVPAATRPSSRMRDDTILSASELAAAFQLNIPKMPRQRRRRPLVTFLSMLLVAAIAITIVLLIRADYRTSAWTWAQTTWSNWQGRGPSPVAPKPSPTVAEPPEEVIPMVMTPATKTTDAGTTDTRTTLPAARVDPAPTQPIAKDPTPPPASVVVTPPPTAQALPAPTATPVYNPSDDTGTRIRKLRNAALDAEGRGDFREAVRMYEQIRQYPREFWPGDLQIRLNTAKDNAN